MGNSFGSLQAEVGRQLERAALGYLKAGLSLFHVARKSSHTNFQPAVGNLCIAVELLLKTLIARKAFPFLYANLPVEAHVHLSYPEAVPDVAAFKRYSIDLKGFKKFKALELDACISLFYTFFPADKQEFRPYLSLLSEVRNPSVHAALPAFQAYHLHRVAYIALKLSEHFEEHQVLKKFAYISTKEDRAFLKQFNKERVDRVKKAVKAAEEKSKTSEPPSVSVIVEGWDVYPTQCLVCGSDAFLYGSTDVYGDSEEDVSLEFDADSFECDACGLKLEDTEELRLAGMHISYDRSDEWDDWMSEQAYEE